MKSVTILIVSAVSISAVPLLKDWRVAGSNNPRSIQQWGTNSTHQSSEAVLQKPLVSAESLANKTSWDVLMDGVFKLQSFVNVDPALDRAFGGPAHMDTIKYLYDEINALDYYDVYMQEQVQLWSETSSSLKVNGTDYVVRASTHAPSGEVAALLIHAFDLGCSASDYPAAISGNIALIRRGNCSFSDKVSMAGSAGAIGTIIYNNMPGSIRVPVANITDPISSYGPDSTHPLETVDHYVPTVFLGEEDGLVLASRAAAGLYARLSIVEVTENRTTYNVIAQTKGGDPDNVVVLGAHTDSVNGASGINDNGSGTIGLLSVAKTLPKFSVNNAVRFCWWTAQEAGRLGSTYYVNHLSEQELGQIAMYLDFDRIASTNYVYNIVASDGPGSKTKGPSGSTDIRAFFERFYDNEELEHMSQEIDETADYIEFDKKGIPVGGINTGSYGIKTKQEAEYFLGDADLPYDSCYKKDCDTLLNLSLPAFAINYKAIAYAVGTFARSLESIRSRAV